MLRYIIAAVAVCTFVLGSTATVYACGSNAQTASKKEKSKNKVKAEKREQQKKPRAPRA